MKKDCVFKVSLSVFLSHFWVSNDCTVGDLCRWCTKLRKHFVAIVEVFCCFTVAIGLAMYHASDYNEDKRSVVAARMQNKGGCRVKQQ